MPLIYIDEDEWYPVRSARICSGDEGVSRGYNTFDVSFETLERWNRVFEEFSKVQNEMGDADREAEYLKGLPVHWWSIVVRSGTSYTRDGFYGNEIEAELEVFKKERETNLVVDLYEASKQHATTYEFESHREEFYDSIQEDLST